ncbi:AfsR/SARP family transcriptional regulator [Nonomuraea sp. NPDC000554]|uniref:AfsR/SARP family transcriptional regulator n=1 Tax=Nonomuraea sp. NPDC000554 TaxID=3154259 RepID=UPI00331F8363
MDLLEFRLLGSIDACHGGSRLELGPRKRRYALAALLLDLNRTVPVERLIDAVWEGEPPDSARVTVQGHVYRLRRTLVPAVMVETAGAGYVLRAEPCQVDALRFMRLVGEAGDADDERGADLLDEALELWAGPAFGGPGGGKPLEVAAVELEEARLSAVEELARRRLRLGQPERAVSHLRAAVTADPHRERLVALLMTAFYQLGRQAEALDLYDRTRRWLSEHLGVDPGPELRATFESLLAGRP